MANNFVLVIKSDATMTGEDRRITKDETHTKDETRFAGGQPVNQIN